MLHSFLFESSQDPLVQNQDGFRQPHLQEYFHRNCTYYLLFKDQHLVFPCILHPWDVTFFPTSYLITENEFGHSA